VASTDLGVTAPSPGLSIRSVHRYVVASTGLDVTRIPAASACSTVTCCDVNRFGCDYNGNTSEAGT
jgi:hypothetical protein